MAAQTRFPRHNSPSPHVLQAFRLRSFANPAGGTPALHRDSTPAFPTPQNPPRLRASAGNPFPIRPQSSALGRTAAPAFSLVEMLVVIAIIGILSALAVPAFRGLAGSSGVRGGTDTILGALSVAQSAALESGGNAYLAFPNDTFSRFIVLTQNATGQTNLATPRWFKLPTGIRIDFSNTDNLFMNISATLPPIDGSNAPATVRAIRYDRFGSLRGTGKLVVGEGFGTNWTGPAESRSTFAAQPLIGKWTPTNN